MKTFSTQNYSHFFRDVKADEVFAVDDTFTIDTVKGIALLSGFTVEPLPERQLRAKAAETVKVGVELVAYQDGVIREVIKPTCGATFCAIWKWFLNLDRTIFSPCRGAAPSPLAT